jgi:hypothetical protein
MARLLTKLNEVNTMQDDSQRIALQRMIKDELEKWDEPIVIGQPNGNVTMSALSEYASRAASPPSYGSSNVDVRAKSAWRQQ